MIGVIIIMENNLRLYREHDIMTEIKTMKHMVTGIAKDIKTIVAYVQNILLHQHWSEAYGVKLTEERKMEPFIRNFEDKLIFLSKLGYTHISEKKLNENKMIGICRDFSVVAAALCREAGIPARARCGFANYFEKGKYIDHWVLFEYMIGHEVKNIGHIPEDMVLHKVEPSVYAVFRSIGPITESVQKTWDYIYSVWLNESEYMRRNTDDIEYYFHNNGELVAELYIPIILK